MQELDQFQIIQEIAQSALSAIEDGWRELIISCCIDDSQSSFSSSYLIEEGGGLKEKALETGNDLDFLFRNLRDHLAQGGKQPFTKCKLHISADGKFDTTYGYEELDFDDFFDMGWNFFPIKDGASQP